MKAVPAAARADAWMDRNAHWLQLVYLLIGVWAIWTNELATLIVTSAGLVHLNLQTEIRELRRRIEADHRAIWGIDR